VVRRIETLLGAVAANGSDEEFRQLLRNLVPDFHPHPSPSDDTLRGVDEEPVIVRRAMAASGAEEAERMTHMR
jgi:hypothetical protein